MYFVDFVRSSNIRGPLSVNDGHCLAAARKSNGPRLSPGRKANHCNARLLIPVSEHLLGVRERSPFNATLCEFDGTAERPRIRIPPCGFVRNKCGTARVLVLPVHAQRNWGRQIPSEACLCCKVRIARG